MNFKKTLAFVNRFKKKPAPVKDLLSIATTANVPQLGNMEDCLKETPLMKSFSHVIMHKIKDDNKSLPTISTSAIALKLSDDGLLYSAELDQNYVQSLIANTHLARYRMEYLGKSFASFTKKLPDNIPARDLFFTPSVDIRNLTEDIYFVRVGLARMVIFMYGNYEEFCKYKQVTIMHFMVVLHKFATESNSEVDKMVWEHIKPRFSCALEHCLKKITV